MMMAVALVTATAAMAADRDTPERDGAYVALTAAEAIPAGALTGVCTNGYAYAAATDKTLSVIGRCERAVVSNDVVKVKRGVFRWVNGPGASADKDIGATCYVSNSVTVSLTAPSAAYTNAAGKVSDVDASGVWVRSGY